MSRIKKEKEKEAPLTGLDHKFHRYTSLSLQKFGLCMIKPNKQAAGKLNDFFNKFSKWDPAKEFKFKNIRMYKKVKIIEKEIFYISATNRSL